MSTDSPASSSSFYNNNDDDDGLNFKTALVVVGAVLGFIVFLLVLRFGCNVAIDLCILCDLREARRTLSDLRDSFCFWRRRGVVAPETTTSGELVLVEQQQQQGGEEQSEQAAVERLLQGLSDTERSIVISTLLKGMVSSSDCWLNSRTKRSKLNFVLTQTLSPVRALICIVCTSCIARGEARLASVETTIQ